ncbi:MAG: hypothetical protein J5I94_16330 [Phaeodactylibacter sp.]|nr:hypothetical protein [Phaeodactylibacter sp.]
MKSNLLAFGLLLFGALCIAQEQKFEIYVSDAGGFNVGNPPWRIYKFDENGENGEIFIEEQLAWPQDIVFLDHRNSLIVSNLNTNKITEYDAETGDYLGDFATGIGGPTRMKIGPDGLLYVLQWGGDGKVLRYSLDGNLVGRFTDMGVSNSIGLDWDEDGNLYVSSYDEKYVQQFSPTGESTGRYISSNLSGPTNIWFDDEGNLFVADWVAGNVKKFDASGNYEGVFINGIGQVEGVSFFSNGNILLGDGQDGSVNLYDSDGNFVEELIPAGTLGLATPNAVVLREVVMSSVRETPKQFNFITPTIGAEFNAITTPGAHPAIEAFEVYDVLGRLAARIPYSGNGPFWNASGQADGLYLIVARLEDGKAWSQKVVVKK